MTEGGDNLVHDDASGLATPILIGGGRKNKKAGRRLKT
jgi:hypothetical protein